VCTIWCVEYSKLLAPAHEQRDAGRWSRRAHQEEMRWRSRGGGTKQQYVHHFCFSSSSSNRRPADRLCGSIRLNPKCCSSPPWHTAGVICSQPAERTHSRPCCCTTTNSFSVVPVAVKPVRESSSQAHLCDGACRQVPVPGAAGTQHKVVSENRCQASERGTASHRLRVRARRPPCDCPCHTAAAALRVPRPPSLRTQNGATFDALGINDQ
jgi:hypothetical protein